MNKTQRTIHPVYQQATFIKSAAKLDQLPEDIGFEVAFAGRSNAGKSSALNAITSNQGLARTSKTPGRTQLINLFAVGDEQRLVDLPGYGYAKVSLEIKARWQETLAIYLEQRRCLQGLILLMDIRHPLTPLDRNMLEWATRRHLRVHILLTKADKLSKGPAQNTVQAVKREVSAWADTISVQAFSSLKKQGLETVWQCLDKWLQFL